MIRTLLVSLLFIPLVALSQNETDSVAYYKSEIARINQLYEQERRSNPELKRYTEAMHRLAAKTDDYTASSLFFTASSADYNKINQELNAAGFPDMNGYLMSFGFGTSVKQKRMIIEYSFSVGFNKKSKKDGESIKIYFANLLEVNAGYDLIRSNKFNLYPYAGLTLRHSRLEYNAAKQNNPSPTNITNIVVTDRSVKDEILQLGYQAGVGIELMLGSPSEVNGVYFVMKAGTNGGFGNNYFKLSGFKYDAALSAGELNLQVGFKFYHR